MKKAFIFLFALALALGLCLVMLTPVAANPGTTYYVSTTGSDETGDGSWYYPWRTIQYAVGQVASGDTIDVAPGTYVENPGIVIDKNLSIIGAGSAETIIKPSGDTASIGAMFLVNPDITFHISDVTLDGTGKKVWYALKYQGGGSVTDCDFKNIQYNPSGPDYQGIAICAYGEAYDDTIDFDDNVDITGCTFTGIGRVGVLYFGPGITDSTYSDNTYVGKGDGDWLDYALDVGSGPTVTITGSTISDCRGVASSDGSTSAGIMVTDLYRDYCPAYSSTEATITDNDISDCSFGIAVGYDDTDLSVVSVSGNTFEDNRYQVDCTASVDVDLEATLADNTFDRAVVVRGSGIKVPTIFSSIQDAIDAASAGDTIDVYPGTYNQDEANDRDLYNGGAGSTDLNIFVDKSVTIQGVDEDGNPITNADDVEAFVIPERDTPLGNLCTIFIQADDVVITGVDVTAYDDPDYNFKTISVIGDNVTIKDCELHARDQVSCIYMYDPRYVSSNDTSYIQSYTFEDNYLDVGGLYASGIRISSGPGWSGDVANRIIEGNTFDWGSYGIEFVGPGGDSWDVYPVGAATVTANNFSGQDRGSVVAWGKYKDVVGYGDLDWDSIFSNNTFDKSVIVKTSGGAVRYYDYTSGPPNFYYVRGIYSAIQRYPIDRVAQAGDTINVGLGTYDEQVVITKSLTLQGTGDTTIIRPSGAGILTSVYTYPAGFSYYSGVKIAGIVTVKNVAAPGVTVKGLKVDGVNVTSLPAGAARLAGILYGNSAGTIDNVTVNTIKTTGYVDRTYGIDLSGGSNVVTVEVKNSRISDFARNGIMANGINLTANVHDNIIVGPGSIGPDNVPNGIVFMADLGGTIIHNTITGCHYTGSTWLSEGIMMFDTCQPGVVIEDNEVYDTDVGIGPYNDSDIYANRLHDCLWGIELEAGAAYNDIHNNDIYNNTHGINLLGPADPGYTPGDEPGPGNKANFNNIHGNTVGVQDYDNTQTLDATGNWWGDASGPYQATTNPSGTGDVVSDNVDYSPWWGGNYIGVAHPWEWYTNDSIQDAIDAASAGDTVNVVAGTYAGFEVTKDDLTIQGPTAAVVSGAAPTRDAVVYVGSGVDSITIQGLTIDASGLKCGIRATESGTYSNIAILDSIIKDFKKSGIVVRYASTVQLEGNNISTTDHSEAPNGIQVGNIGDTTGTTGTIEGNQISGCHWDGYDPETETYEDEWTGSGILIIDTESALEISDNEVQGCDVGMDIESGTPTTITGNDVHDNSYGFVLWNAAPTINYNTIYQNALYGVYCAAGGSFSAVDATHNWWGAASGPFHATLNPNGEGNAVSDNVLFEPWFSDEEMTTLVSHSTYKFDYEVPGVIVAREETVVPVTFETDELGQVGYDNIRFKFSASGPGDVIFKAKDSANQTYTFTNWGYWGPSAGFNLTADYTATTDWSLNFSEPGVYNITFSLIVAPDGAVVAGIEGSEIVTVRAHDILDYYRRLHAPYDKVSTLDLLAAADDWSGRVTPPGFAQPITTLQLLALADEWFAS